MKTALWVVAAVLVVLALAMAAGLWRARRDGTPWGRDDYFRSLGIVVPLLAAVGALVLANNVTVEPREVVAHRTEVRAACAAIRSVGANDPIPAAIATGQRSALEQGLQQQHDAWRAVLDDLWIQTSPTQLTSDVESARQDATNWSDVGQQNIDSIQRELPSRITWEIVNTWSSTKTNALVAATRMESSMSHLAGEPCQVEH